MTTEGQKMMERLRVAALKRRQRVLRMHQRGKTLREIAATLNVTYQRAQQLLAEAKVTEAVEE
jgi:DNA-directed RNA polymerase sigma subunit (sigma70/sigma32)